MGLVDGLSWASSTKRGRSWCRKCCRKAGRHSRSNCRLISVEAERGEAGNVGDGMELRATETCDLGRKVVFKGGENVVDSALEMATFIQLIELIDGLVSFFEMLVLEQEMNCSTRESEDTCRTVRQMFGYLHDDLWLQPV